MVGKAEMREEDEGFLSKIDLKHLNVHVSAKQREEITSWFREWKDNFSKNCQ